MGQFRDLAAVNRARLGGYLLGPLALFFVREAEQLLLGEVVREMSVALGHIVTVAKEPGPGGGLQAAVIERQERNSVSLSGSQVRLEVRIEPDPDRDGERLDPFRQGLPQATRPGYKGVEEFTVGRE